PLAHLEAHVGLDDAGEHRVDANPLAGELDRPRPAERHEPALGGRVVGLASPADVGAGRGDVDDLAAALPQPHLPGLPRAGRAQAMLTIVPPPGRSIIATACRGRGKAPVRFVAWTEVQSWSVIESR